MLLEAFLISDLNFTKSDADPCVYVYNVEDSRAYILVWVDDLILAASSDVLLSCIKNSLNTRFDMKDLGPLKYFLGIEFSQKDDTVVMSQVQYLTDILHRYNMSSIRVRRTPCEQNLSVYESEEFVTDPMYREAVGSLVYAMVCTRPDLSFVVTRLSQHVASPTKGDMLLLKHVFQYIKGTVDYCLKFRKIQDHDLKLHAYCDADWGSSRDDRRSITGYCFLLCEYGPVISWKSRKQPSVALSTCEAEYMALSATCQEAIFLARLFDNLSGRVGSIDIMCDNQGTIALAKNPVKHSRTKHIDIRHHFVRDLVENGFMAIHYVPSDSNLADPFTKCLGRIKWANVTEKLIGI